DRLAKGEVRAGEQREAQHRQIEEDAAQPDNKEKQHAIRYVAVGQLLGEKQQVFDAGKRIELARAAASGPKAVGQFDDTQRPHRGSENVDQDLCANPREAWRNLVDKRAAQHKKTADRVGDIGLDQTPREAGAVNAEPLAPVGRQPFRAAGFDIAAGMTTSAASSLSALCMRGSRVSSCCRSPSMTATNGAEVASMPSMQAELSPRRPMRRMQRMRGSRSPSARMCSAVPSGESSSTNTTSQAMPRRVRSR